MNSETRVSYIEKHKNMNSCKKKNTKGNKNEETNKTTKDF